MKNKSPQWGQESRFYLPNEDAHLICAALRYLPHTPRQPVFVGGSGMVLLEALAEMSSVVRATFADISAFQVDYFHSLLMAIEKCANPIELQEWFSESIYPQLFEHFSVGRNQNYPLEQVMDALRNLFRVRFFFEPDIFDRVKAATVRIQSVESDIVAYLSDPGSLYDFVYLSNVPDYLPENQLPDLFCSCARQNAPIYLLLTEACVNPSAERMVWEAAGYIEHPASAELTDQNRALGSFTLQRVWNRKGRIVLLVPDA
jgi:hypothetical protein